MLNEQERLFGWPFSFHLSFIGSHVNFFTREGHRCCCGTVAKKRFQCVILNDYVQTSSPKFSLEEELLPCKTMETL